MDKRCHVLWQTSTLITQRNCLIHIGLHQTLQICVLPEKPVDAFVRPETALHGRGEPPCNQLSVNQLLEQRT